MAQHNPLAVHPAVWLPEWSTQQGAIAIRRAESYGYDHVVVPLRTPESINPVAIERVFRGTEVRPVNTANQLPEADLSSHDPEIRRAGQQRLRLAIRLARDMGSPHIGGVLYGCLHHASKPASDTTRRISQQSLAEVAEEAKTAGVRLAVEIVNRYETNLLNTVENAVSFLDETGSDNLFLHLDTFHMNIEESDMHTAILRAIPYMVYFELAQNHRGALDEGHIPVRMLLETALKAGYRDMIGVEAFTRQVLAAEMIRTLAIWRTVFDDGDEVARSAVALIRRASMNPD